MIYLENPRTVEAIQWSGDNLDECKAFVTGSAYYDFTSSEKTLVITLLHPVPGACCTTDVQYVRPTNWIVKQQLGDVITMLDETFRRCYRAAGREDIHNQRPATDLAGEAECI